MRRLLLAAFAAVALAGAAGAQGTFGVPPVGPVSNPGPSSNLSDAGAWSTYSSTAACASGSLTTYTAAGRYKQFLGKTTVLQITLTVTTVGTCTGVVILTLPSGINVNATGSIYAGSSIDSTVDASLPLFAYSGNESLEQVGTPAAHIYSITITFEAA